MSTGGDKTERTSLLVLVLSFIVGPIGIVGGAALLARRPVARARTLAIAAVIVGVIQTVVVGLVLANWFGPGGGTPRPQPSPTTPAASSPSPTAGATPEGSPSPTESARPTPTATRPSSWPTGDVGSFLEPEVADYEAHGFTEDPAGTATGAEEAYQGTYGSGQFEITVKVTSWESREAAEEAVVAAAKQQFPSGDPVKSGDVGSPDVVGQYRYYERDGRATIFWNDGRIMVIAAGKPLAVQEFFVFHPRHG